MGRTGLERGDGLPCLLKHKKERSGEGRRKGRGEREGDGECKKKRYL